MAEFIEVPPWVSASLDEDAPAVRPAGRVLPPSEAPSKAADSLVIVLNTGVRIPVTGRGLVGRAPAARAGEVAHHLVSVGEHERSVSKTHLAFEPEGDQLWVTDRRSTNGTAVTGAAGSTVCRPGAPVSVAVGDTVRFGDLSFTLERG